jgi:hypothetical protein
MASSESESSRAPSEPRDLEDILDRLEESGEAHGQVSLDAMLETVGRRSFGPILLVAGLIALSPLSGIPGMPSVLGLLVLLVAGQLLLRRTHFWLPRWMLRREVNHRKLCQATGLMRRPARVIDRFLRPRLTFLTRHVGACVIIVVCVLIALSMPPLEILPFTASLSGAALSTFALALISNDGLVAVIGFLITGGVVGVVLYGML